MDFKEEGIPCFYCGTTETHMGESQCVISTPEKVAIEISYICKNCNDVFYVDQWAGKILGFKRDSEIEF